MVKQLIKEAKIPNELLPTNSAGETAELTPLVEETIIEAQRRFPGLTEEGCKQLATMILTRGQYDGLNYDTEHVRLPTLNVGQVTLNEELTDEEKKHLEDAALLYKNSLSDAGGYFVDLDILNMYPTPQIVKQNTEVQLSDLLTPPLLDVGGLNGFGFNYDPPRMRMYARELSKDPATNLCLDESASDSLHEK